MGSTIMPIVFTNAETGERFCIKLYALVLENLLMGMFIGTFGSRFLETRGMSPEKDTFTMKFPNGQKVKVDFEHGERYWDDSSFLHREIIYTPDDDRIFLLSSRSLWVHVSVS